MLKVISLSSDKACPDEETLACFVDGLLNKKEQIRIIKHLLGCDKCLETVLLGIRLSNI